MAITATLVAAGNNRLRYLLSTAVTTADSVTISTSGAATPDVRTDSPAGPIKALALAAVNGYGEIGPASITQAQSRQLWLSDNGDSFGPSVRPSTGELPTAQCTIEDRTSGATFWAVDANVSGANPTIVVNSLGAAGTAYLDIFIPGAIGA